MHLLHAALVAVLLLAAPALADDGGSTAPNDPIDAALDQCLAKPDGESTEGMVACFGAAYQSWDKELNGVYRELLDSLDADQKEALKTAQRQWLAFRDADDAFLTSLQGATSGSLLRVSANEAMANIVKARVMQLRGYRDMDR
jgi:uncharacterized protein YecT (DUF1311 family)